MQVYIKEIGDDSFYENHSILSFLVASSFDAKHFSFLISKRGSTWCFMVDRQQSNIQLVRAVEINLERGPQLCECWFHLLRDFYHKPGYSPFEKWKQANLNGRKSATTTIIP